MSDNYRLYQRKVEEARSRRRDASSETLSRQLQEIFDTVRWCERIWAIEERIDRDTRLR